MIQIRELHNLSPIKINIVDANTTTALRILPTFKIKDLLCMVNNVIKNRKIKVTSSLECYQIFEPVSKMWLDRNILLQNINIKVFPLSYLGAIALSFKASPDHYFTLQSAYLYHLSFSIYDC